ncbi:type 1 fimbriae anchoring protein FimD [Klebsiella michiganensis]|nr:type 1 fimbriae anchoring protein FimD [Klebsiella michiganensis]
MTLSASSNKKGDSVSQMGLSGSALEDKNLSWNVQQGYNSKGSDTMGSAAVNYKGRHGEYQLGYSYSRDSRSFQQARWAGWWCIHTVSPRLSRSARPWRW